MNFSKIRPNGFYTLKKKKGNKNSKCVKKEDCMRDFAKKANKSVKKAAPKALCNHVDAVTHSPALKMIDKTTAKCLLCGRIIHISDTILTKEALDSSAEMINSVFGLMRMNGLSGDSKNQIEKELIITEKWNLAASKLYHKYVSPSIIYMSKMRKEGKKNKKNKKNKKKDKFISRLM